LKSIQHHYPGREVKPVSAGECYSHDLSRAAGGSSTLNLTADHDDGVTMSTYDFTHGLA
jgi:hypothetical protein